MDLVYKRLVYEIANERTVMARLRRCELRHQDRDEPLFWVYPKGCPECPDPIEFPDGAGIRIMPGRDSDRKAKAEALTVLEVRSDRTKLPAKTYPGPVGKTAALIHCRNCAAKGTTILPRSGPTTTAPPPRSTIVAKAFLSSSSRGHSTTMSCRPSSLAIAAKELPCSSNDRLGPTANQMCDRPCCRNELAQQI
jgi:hypothetical protein